MTEFYHNLSMQALSKSDDIIILQFEVIREFCKNKTNYYIKNFNFKLEKKKLDEDFQNFTRIDFIKEKANVDYNIENEVIEAIINNNKIDIPEEKYPMSQTVKEIKKRKRRK